MMNIFEKISDLNLAKEDYIIVGGGVLVALNLLEWDDDIDICVTQEIFDRYQKQGWQVAKWGSKTVLKQGIYDVGIDFGDWTLKELQADKILINGLPFMSLDKLMIWKQQMNRPKDQKHIELINKCRQYTGL